MSNHLCIQGNASGRCVLKFKSYHQHISSLVITHIKNLFICGEEQS